MFAQLDLGERQPEDSRRAEKAGEGRRDSHSGFVLAQENRADWSRAVHISDLFSRLQNL